MDPVRNPYSPGAGTRPPALVGRDHEIDAMDVALQRLLLGRDGRSQMLTGLRGVGKTVLLNEFEQLGDARGYFHEHIEVAEDGMLAPALVAAFRRILLAMDAKRRIGERIVTALGILKAFSLRMPGVELNIDVDAIHGPADSGDLASDLAALFVELGEVARDHHTGVLLTIDELHYVDIATFSALVVGLHRASQLRLPITIAGAGLPSLASLTGDAKTYAERMFMFPKVGSLAEDLAAEALATPARDEGVRFDDDALARVLAVTRCYPYFLQEFAKAAWDVADGPDAILLDDVERSLPLAVAELDDGFFRVRTGRTSDGERLYLRAMAELGPGPVKSADVAALLGKRTNALAPTRDTLIRRAICFSPRWGEIDFTVPMFDEFMKRWMPRASELPGETPGTSG
ncbi:MAG TPA: ATP-binding protein [Acidimicrobiia bacterium]